MPLTPDEIQELRDGLRVLEEEFNLEPYGNEIDEDIEYLQIPFPFEDGEIEIDIEYALQYFRELKSFKVHEYSKVSTSTVTEWVIAANNSIPALLGFAHSTTKDDISLGITSEPFLVGLAATRMKEFDEYHCPCSSHLAVYVHYPDESARIPEIEEENLVKSFLFEVSHTCRVGFSFSTFEKPKNINVQKFIEQIQNLPTSTEDYNIGMELFIAANQSLSAELKFLGYYKIFEYFAPLCSKIDAFDAMRRKLDSSNAVGLQSATFVDSIFDLARSYEKSLRDKELIRSLIDTTFDLVDIYGQLPTSVRSQVNIDKLGYKEKKDRNRALAPLSDVLYATRNSIVHAKSNYNLTGLECREEDLPQLNEFMHMACYSTIKWYNRLPDHLKV